VHEAQHGLGVGLGGEEAAQGEARGPELDDKVEALAAVAGAREEVVGDGLGDEA
jgi:hypothetical protein